MITTAEGFYPRLSDHPAATPAERPHYAWGARTDGRPRELPRAIAPGIAARLEANHGRWVAHCPFCPSAQVASEGDRRLLCIACDNAPVGGAWVRVAWPSEPERRAIEDALGRRADPRNRNWTPEESAEDLRRENRERGVE